MYLSLSSPGSDPGPQQVSHFMRLDRQAGRLSPLLAERPIPHILRPSAQQPWPAQLDTLLSEPIEQLLRRSQAACLCLQLQHEHWLLEFIPESAPYWLICARNILAHDNPASSQGLALLDLEKQASQPAGLARNRQVLELLQQMLGCDRLILWSQQQDQLHPLFMLGSGALPASQTMELRYQKALRSRGILGFSNLVHQPMLQNQLYLHQEGILARLDVQLKYNNQSCGLLTLEYRSIQESFSPLSFHLAEKAATLLMLPTNLGSETIALAWLPEFNKKLVWCQGDAYWLALAHLLNDHGHAAQVMIFQHHNQNWKHLLTFDRGTRLPHIAASLYTPVLQTLLPTTAHLLTAEEIQDLRGWSGDATNHIYFWYPVCDEQARVAGAMIIELYQGEPTRLEQVLELTHYRNLIELMTQGCHDPKEQEEMEATAGPSVELTLRSPDLNSVPAEAPTQATQDNHPIPPLEDHI